MTVDSDLREAVLIDGFAIDPETGEIYGDRTPDLDRLAMLLKDGQEQEKAWGAHNAMIKAAIGRQLDDLGVRVIETKYGTACWRVQNRRSAKADRFRELAAEYGVCDDWARRVIADCATALDPKILSSELTGFIGPLSPEAAALSKAMEETIEEKTVSYVLLQPLRKAAPKLERETVDTGGI